MSKTPKSVQIRVNQKSNNYLSCLLRELRKTNPYACNADAVQALIDFRESHQIKLVSRKISDSDYKILAQAFLGEYPAIREADASAKLLARILDYRNRPSIAEIAAHMAIIDPVQPAEISAMEEE